MIKYFHELTQEEFKELLQKTRTWKQLAEDYPKPPWCGFENATGGLMGCWSLTSRLVTGEEHCAGCDEYISDYQKLLAE